MMPYINYVNHVPCSPIKSKTQYSPAVFTHGFSEQHLHPKPTVPHNTANINKSLIIYTHHPPIPFNKSPESTKATFGTGDRSQQIDLPIDEPITLRIFIDRSITDVYLNGHAMTFATYPPHTHKALRIIETTHADTIQSIDIQQMNSIRNT